MKILSAYISECFHLWVLPSRSASIFECFTQVPHLSAWWQLSKMKSMIILVMDSHHHCSEKDMRISPSNVHKRHAKSFPGCRPYFVCDGKAILARQCLT
jgi:hypothetical protein